MTAVKSFKGRKSGKSGTLLVLASALLMSCIFGKDEDSRGGNPGPEKKVWFDTVYYPSKKPRHITRHVDSLRQGITWSLFETGELEAVGFNENGVRWGWSMSFFQNAKTNQEYFWKAAKIVCLKQFSESGELLAHDPVCLDEYYSDSTYTVWKIHVAAGGK
ncbi:MAG: hypothetical protein M3Y08_05255 [Fibrobacterota bacterium]|nr:hypothetical protein [Fibrobacterota bacterium]